MVSCRWNTQYKFRSFIFKRSSPLLGDFFDRRNVKPYLQKKPGKKNISKLPIYSWFMTEQITKGILRMGLTTSMILACSNMINAQNDVPIHNATASCAHVKTKHFNQLAKTTVASPLEDNYDVKYVQLDVSVTNQDNSINGNATTRALVVVPMLSDYVFELHPMLTVDSVKINGQLHTVSSAGYVRTIALTNQLPQNTMFTAQVFYHGQPPNNSGIKRQQSFSWGAWVTYTLSEPYGSRDWWPCKQSLQDKIDSSDIWITVPNNLKAGSNGVLKAITPIGSTHSRYEWKERFPIDYYLLSLAASTYVDYSYYMHFSGSNDSMLVQNYVYSNSGTLPWFQDIIDSTGMQVDFFSGLFGRYPFWEEKYGHCMAPFAGGMEHQTMTSLGFFESTLIAHELGHQWFGNHVTCATWADIWVNEGFASYSEYLFRENYYGSNDAFNFMHDVHEDVKSQPGGTLYVDDTTDDARIFDGRLTYNKGNSVVHMLRFVAGNDNDFFQVLKDYQQQFANSTATTEDFRAVAEQVTGQNLDTFFTQWVYKEGYPIYSATWNQVGNQVFVQLNQTTSKPISVATFATPIELRLQSPQGDTIVRVYNNLPVQNFSFTWEKNMNGMAVDPAEWLLRQVNTISHDITLNVDELALSEIKVYPNPATDNWIASGIGSASKLLLTDISGRVLWKQEAGSHAVNIPAATLATGLYLLRITTAEGRSYSIKLAKQ